MQIAIANLGVGNLRSVSNALKAVSSADIVISDSMNVLRDADKIVIPGQGAFATWMHSLHEKRLHDVLYQAISEKPVLGICVGMQAMFASSEEGGLHQGLGLFAGEIQHFTRSEQYHQKTKVPHMGWNAVTQQNTHPLWHNIDNESCFYFVHSYCAQLRKTPIAEFVMGKTHYAGDFISAVAKGNLFAVQFHPEKSQQPGLQLLRNFCHWDGNQL